MTKVVVTGGAGFIGSHIVDGCVEEGFDVHVIDISSPRKGHTNKKARYHEADIRNLKSITPIIKDALYVFHLAALPRVQYSIENPEETTETNVVGTMNVLAAAQKGGVKRVIFSSSSSVYGDQPTLPFKEDMTPAPKSPYALHKLVGEQYCSVWNTVYGLETVSLRYFNIYGPRMSPQGSYPLAIALFIDQRKKGKPMTITGDGKQTRDFTHVSDVVKANILAAKSSTVGKGECINIGFGKGVSMLEITKLIGGPTKFIAPRLEPKHTLADNAKAKKLLQWKPTISIEEGIKAIKNN